MDSNGFAPLADRPPFDVSPEELEAEEDRDVSPAVAQVLGICAEAGLDFKDFLDLAVCCLAEASADLAADLEPDEMAADPVIVATIERLTIAAQVIAGVDLCEDDDEDEDEGADKEGEEAEAA